MSECIQHGVPLGGPECGPECERLTRYHENARINREFEEFYGRHDIPEEG